MSMNRRDFLRQAGTTGVCGSLLGFACGRAEASTAARHSEEWMGVLVDIPNCNGCRRCEAACQEAAGFEAPPIESLQDRSVFAKDRRPGPRTYTTVNEYAGKADGVAAPTVRVDEFKPASIYVKANCLHCNDPACASACLVGALRKQANGAVTYDVWKCMGCRYCMVACPFQIPTYEYDRALTPQVRKCTFCADEGNPNRGGIPACVQRCPKECLTYGKRTELLARAHEKIQQHPDVYLPRVYGEHEAGGTSWLYLSGVPFEAIGFLPIGPEAPPRLSETIQHGVFKHFVPPVAWVTALGIAMWLSRPEGGDGAPGSAGSP